MCYPKPGPRCAGHLREHIASLEARRDRVAVGFMAGHDTEDPNRLNRELVQAREEYEETATARRAANARIETMPEGPEKTAAVNALAFAAARWQAKINAYRALEGGLGALPSPSRVQPAPTAPTSDADRTYARLGAPGGPRMSTRPAPGYERLGAPTQPAPRPADPISDYETVWGSEMVNRYPAGAASVAAEERQQAHPDFMPRRHYPSPY